jgi:hypothetical protein
LVHLIIFKIILFFTSKDFVEFRVIAAQPNVNQLLFFQVTLILLLIQLKAGNIRKVMLSVERNSRQLHYHWLSLLYKKAFALNEDFDIGSTKTLYNIINGSCVFGPINYMSSEPARSLRKPISNSIARIFNGDQYLLGIDRLHERIQALVEWKAIINLRYRI